MASTTNNSLLLFFADRPFYGMGFGATGQNVTAELCFNTAMTG
jgi:carbamoylphosphate synthase small subunit